MKVRLTVCGVDRGEIEVSPESIVGLLLCGELGRALAEVEDLKLELLELMPDCGVEISVSASR